MKSNTAEGGYYLTTLYIYNFDVKNAQTSGRPIVETIMQLVESDRHASIKNSLEPFENGLIHKEACCMVAT